MVNDATWWGGVGDIKGGKGRGWRYDREEQILSDGDVWVQGKMWSLLFIIIIPRLNLPELGAPVGGGGSINGKLFVFDMNE